MVRAGFNLSTAALLVTTAVSLSIVTACKPSQGQTATKDVNAPGGAKQLAVGCLANIVSGSSDSSMITSGQCASSMSNGTTTFQPAFGGGWMLGESNWVIENNSLYYDFSSFLMLETSGNITVCSSNTAAGEVYAVSGTAGQGFNQFKIDSDGTLNLYKDGTAKTPVRFLLPDGVTSANPN